MTKSRKYSIVALVVIVTVLLVDQYIKYSVKTGMTLHQTIPMIDDWAMLFFTENKGMAFGMDFMGTMVLCSFRIIAVLALVYYMRRLVRMDVPLGFVICVSLVLAGAAGNIFDNMFYGLVFTESTEFSVASLVPFGEGYGGFLSGKVVDMFYFPMIDTVLPDWVPWKGGERFVFFAPIFNFADSAISCGGIAVIIFYHKTFSRLFAKNESKEEIVAATELLKQLQKDK